MNREEALRIVRRRMPRVAKALEPRKAYTAVLDPELRLFIIGLAEEGTRGYTPFRHRTFERYEQAREFAGELNKDLGLTPKEAWAIVAGTM